MIENAVVLFLVNKTQFNNKKSPERVNFDFLIEQNQRLSNTKSRIFGSRKMYSLGEIWF
jgi:hypothetical protein